MFVFCLRMYNKLASTRKHLHPCKLQSYCHVKSLPSFQKWVWTAIPIHHCYASVADGVRLCRGHSWNCSGGVIPLLRFWILLLWKICMSKSSSFLVFVFPHQQLVSTFLPNSSRPSTPRHHFGTTTLPFFFALYFFLFFKHFDLYDLLIIPKYAFAALNLSAFLA